MYKQGAMRRIHDCVYSAHVTQDYQILKNATFIGILFARICTRVVITP